MSNPESDSDVQEALRRLEAAVDRAVERLESLEGGLRESERRTRELEDLLEKFRSGDEDPARMAEELEKARSRNEELRERLDEGRASVDRILSRIRFLQDQR